MTEQKIILVTGGTSGIGKETVIILAKRGHRVVFTARTREAGEAALSEIQERSGSQDVSYLVCDLASLSAVKQMCDTFLAEHSRLDVLVNNAGVMPQERQESRDGIELNFAINFLAPVLLTRLLLPLLKKSALARIINVSSSMHTEGAIHFADLESKKSFDTYKAYAQSKLALLLFTKELARELEGSGVTVNALHPGVVGTEMTMRNVRKMNPVVAFFFKRTLLTPEEGSRTSVYLATAPEVSGVSGKYFADCKEEQTAAAAEDRETARRLLVVTEEKYLAPYLL